MQLKIYSCSRCVGKNVEFIKHGKTKDGKQRYQCKGCKSTSILKYTYQAYRKFINPKIIQYIKEGLGIRSIARILKISRTTLLKRIIQISNNVQQPKVSTNQTYEVDELCTYIRRKKNRYWLVYALCKETKQIVSFSIGKRNYKTLSSVISSVKNYNPIKIFTDSLIHYKFLIDKSIHQIKRYGTNLIERKNLSLRTHIKRLNRRTICYSKSLAVFSSIMKIYFWS